MDRCVCISFDGCRGASRGAHRQRSRIWDRLLQARRPAEPATGCDRATQIKLDLGRTPGATALELAGDARDLVMEYRAVEMVIPTRVARACRDSRDSGTESEEDDSFQSAHSRKDSQRQKCTGAVGQPITLPEKSGTSS